MMRVMLAFALGLSAVAAGAVEPLQSDVLLRQCAIYERDTVANESISCRAWVHGFIGGAFASRTATLAESGKGESFTDRAARTRLGRSRLEYGRNLQAGYCLPPSTTLDEIIAALNSYASEAKKVPEQANQLMLQLLRARYSCAKQK